LANVGKTGDVKVGDRSTAPKAPVIELPASMSVKELSDLLHISSIEAIKQLMRNGIMANINQIINYDVASLVASGFGYEVKPKAKTKVSASAAGKIKNRLKKKKAPTLCRVLRWSLLWVMWTMVRPVCWMLSARQMSWIPRRRYYSAYRCLPGGDRR
jgi:hypothetical protein